MKTVHILVLLLTCMYAAALFSQEKEKKYDWVRASDEVLRLDPSNYRGPRYYEPGREGLSIRVDVHAQQPVTVGLTQRPDYQEASRDPVLLHGLKYWCVQQHVVTTTYSCELPPSDVPMLLVVHDEREGAGVLLNGIASVLKVPGPSHGLIAPNNVQLTYYRWGCIDNCYVPEFRWSRLLKEKYDLSRVLKVYGLPPAQNDGEEVAVKIKSPVPMLMAVLPAQVAGQLPGRPEMLESAVANSSCQQRGVQSSTLGCTFKPEDGLQSLVVVPEPAAAVPKHKKAEIEVSSNQCVAHCTE